MVVGRSTASTSGLSFAAAATLKHYGKVTNAQGRATLAVSTFQKGKTRTVEARFAGDTSYTAVVSNQTTIVS